MYTTKFEVEKWCNKYILIEKYSINDDLTIDVDGTVYLNNRFLTEIPVQFNVVKGSFNCQKNSLISLKGCPKEVYGLFNCYYNDLASLEHLPIIYGELICDSKFYNSIEYKRWKLMQSLRK